MNNDLNYIISTLNEINPASLDYESWLNVGMAIKNAGGTVDIWDSWSKSDSKYRAGEPQKKWKSFSRDGVGVGTVVEICKKSGGKPPAIESEHRELGWDDTIAYDGPSDTKIVRKEWLQGESIPEAPADWDGMKDLKTYLTTLFEPDDYVGIVIETFDSEPDKDGKIKKLPKKGQYAFQVKQYIKDLDKGNTIEDSIGDYNKDVGAWIRFNPLDKKGVSDKNVTDLRYALVESDDLAIDKQYAIYKELELPIIALVTSGNKSLHAIVKIEADNYKEYQQRVDYLYDVCKENGLSVDRQNRNPSRLSRLPGVYRGKNTQRLIDTNIGKPSWEAWKEWLAEQDDDLPDFENLGDFFDDPPELAPEQIQGVLRKGHKLLVSGPSKAGKSFSLIGLAISIAEGEKWIDWQCQQGSVLYINLELDRRSFIRRLVESYKAKGIGNKNIKNIDMWHLRGKAIPLDKLAPRLLRRALKNNYTAIIIDPLYKVMTGDENSAEQMGKFFNYMDYIGETLDTTMIYCHHHSKGRQGEKSSQDRSSGSGVFTREPDAILDMIELEISEKQREGMINKWVCDAICKDMDSNNKTWRGTVMPDKTIVSKHLIEHVQINYKPEVLQELIDTATLKAKQASGWRIEGTLREFPMFEPVNCYFKYPVHEVDDTGFLEDSLADGELPSREKKIAMAEVIKANNISETVAIWEMIRERGMGNNVTTEDMMKELGIGQAALYTRIKNTKGILKTRKKLVTKEKED